MIVDEGVRPLWKAGGKPLAQLTGDELAEAIRYVETQDAGDVALLKALQALRDEREESAGAPAPAHDESDPPVFACG